MDAMFPEARRTLQEADPEVFQLVQEEKKRQWCAARLSRTAACCLPMLR